MHAERAFNIPYQWRINVENMYAMHSIFYDNLDSYVYGFAIWDDTNTCLSWDETKEWFQLLDLIHVPVLYDGIFDLDILRQIEQDMDPQQFEGYVLRVADSFHYSQFHHSVFKYVRQGHVQTTKHWKEGQPVVPNQLKQGK